MDIKTGLSIFNKQWLIEPEAALQMLDFFDRVKAGEKWSWDAAKGEGVSAYQMRQQFLANSNVILAPESSYDMKDFPGFTGAEIAVIDVSGPLMKSDFCGSFGTGSLRQLTQMAANTPSVHTILFTHDSPGGTVDGTESFAQVITEARTVHGKRTIALCDGLMCSADYWLASAAGEVYASSKTNVIGSIGTMCSMYDTSEASKARGVVLREYYATESSDKNKMHKDAMAGDGKALIQEMLDPMNNVFLGAVRENRGDKLRTGKDSPLTGKTYTAENALAAGLIDGIKSLEEVLQEARQPFNRSTTNSKSLNNTQMATEIKTLAELKAAYPALTAEAAAEGVSQERERVKTWRVFEKLDPAAVAAGIEGTTLPTHSQMAEFGLKRMNATTLTGMAGENAPNVTTGEPAATTETQEEKEAAAFLANCKKDLGLA